MEKPPGSLIHFLHVQLSFLTEFCPRTSSSLPSRWPPRNKVELQLTLCEYLGTILTTIVGRNEGETMKLHVECFDRSDFNSGNEFKISAAEQHSVQLIHGWIKIIQ